MQHRSDIIAPDFRSIEDAYERIRRHIVKTPVVSNAALNAILGCELFCKCENLQEIGAFKIRGAMNAVLSLRERGVTADVATHSSGNHGAAVAAAATLDGRKATVVMPENSVAAKVQNVQRHGGEIRFCAPNQQAREQGLQELIEQGRIPIHPYDDVEIISGQGTAAMELLQQQAGLECLLAPVGGGGLIAGSAIAAKHLAPGMPVIAAEPLGAADTAESMRRGMRVTQWTPDTIADGLRAIVGELTFPIIQDGVERVLTVTEAGILSGMELARKHLGLLIEPSSATVIAAILEHPDLFAGRAVGAIITGGNVDLQEFPGIADEPA